MNFNSSVPLSAQLNIIGSRGIASTLVEVLLLTSTLEEDGWLPLDPVRFSPEKETRYPFYRRLRKPLARLDGKPCPHRCWKLRNVQLVASRLHQLRYPGRHCSSAVGSFTDVCI
jgi:hypothetical protein